MPSPSCDAGSLRVSLKCEPRLAEALRETHPAVIPGYHLNKRHWNTVVIDGSLTDRMVKDMIEDSYDLVVSNLPVSQRSALGWQPDTNPLGPAASPFQTSSPVRRPPDR